MSAFRDQIWRLGTTLMLAGLLVGCKASPDPVRPPEQERALLVAELEAGKDHYQRLAERNLSDDPQPWYWLDQQGIASDRWCRAQLGLAQFDERIDPDKVAAEHLARMTAMRKRVLDDPKLAADALAVATVTYFHEDARAQAGEASAAIAARRAAADAWRALEPMLGAGQVPAERCCLTAFDWSERLMRAQLASTDDAKRRVEVIARHQQHLQQVADSLVDAAGDWTTARIEASLTRLKREAEQLLERESRPRR